MAYTADQDDMAEAEDSSFVANRVPNMSVARRGSVYESRRVDCDTVSFSCIHNKPLSGNMKSVGEGIMDVDKGKTMSPATARAWSDKSCREGFLLKQGSGLLPTWKRRYCVLKDSLFSYYKKRGDVRVQGVLNFDFLKCALTRDESDPLCLKFTYYHNAK